MYIPKHFQMNDTSEQLDFIRQYSFGDLITTYQGKLEINHAPFLLADNDEYLLVHFARNNPHWQVVEKADELKVCFKGPDCYISPNWYTEPAKNVPTWNFLSVQVTGHASLMSDDELIHLLDQLSQKHEAQFSHPWTIEKLSEQQLAAMVKAIVGVKISIEKISGKAKLSQNKSQREITSLLDGLAKQADFGSRAVLEWMKPLKHVQQA